jgi:hypothetical protein
VLGLQGPEETLPFAEDIAPAAPVDVCVKSEHWELGRLAKADRHPQRSAFTANTGEVAKVLKMPGATSRARALPLSGM